MMQSMISRLTRGLAIGTMLAATLPGAHAADAEPTVSHNTLTAQEKADGWVLLFDGESFTGWRGVNSFRVPHHHWVIEDGCIRKIPRDEVPTTADGTPVRGGDLMTVQAFDDFELVADWKVSPGANSGIKYNVDPERSRGAGALGFEYQIIDNKGTPLDLNPMQVTASLYDLLVPAPEALDFDVTEFNTTRIVFRGNHGEHWLNGRKVVEFDLGSVQMADAIEASKFKPLKDFGVHKRGHIVLQDHNDGVLFRNIKIRPLSAN